MSDSYATGDVKGKIKIGGLIGTNSNSGTVLGSYATGSATGNQYIGGLVGANYGAISSSHATGSVDGRLQVGGLVGWNSEGAVNNSYATGNVTGKQIVGGIIGSNSGKVSGSYEIGKIDGDVAQVGGLIGVNGTKGTVSGSYARGSVEGSGKIGGLVGENYGNVSDSFTTGNVEGSDQYIGGLVGLNFGKVLGSYAAGGVKDSEFVGGYMGLNVGTAQSLYWNTSANPDLPGLGGSGSGYAIGLTAEEMKHASAFKEFNFDDTWVILEGVDYPYLKHSDKLSVTSPTEPVIVYEDGDITFLGYREIPA